MKCGLALNEQNRFLNLIFQATTLRGMLSKVDAIGHSQRAGQDCPAIVQNIRPDCKGDSGYESAAKHMIIEP